MIRSGEAENKFWDDMKINRLADLSLQQAVDLASLLMKIEINFQKYTENIPTVGGVVKLAIINKDGFKFISGNEILKSENCFMELAAMVPMPSIFSKFFLEALKMLSASPKVSRSAFARTSPMLGTRVSAI